MKKEFTRQEAIDASTKYFNGDQLAGVVFVNKYALKDKNGVIYEKTPTDMHWRIANELARIESKYPNPLSAQEIFNLLDKFKYIVPQGSPMAGIGNDFIVSSISNCFVVHNGVDSYGGIMKIDEELVQLMKRRGGVGTDLSHIRYKGSKVNNAALTSSGMSSFMERYSNSTREVSQNERRGALMLTVSVKHPDAEDFIDAKLDTTKITGANISVKVDDKFMESVRDGKMYTQQFPIDSDTPEYKKDISAINLWDKIMYNAFKSAEPGILFWDQVIRESVADCYADVGYQTISTNPCQPAWATVLTPEGIKNFNNIKVGDKVWSKNGWSTIVRKQSSGIKPVFKYRTSMGVFFGTENHRVVSNGVKIEAKDAKSIDFLTGYDYKSDKKISSLCDSENDYALNLGYDLVCDSDIVKYQNYTSDFILRFIDGIVSSRSYRKKIGDLEGVLVDFDCLKSATDFQTIASSVGISVAVVKSLEDDTAFAILNIKDICSDEEYNNIEEVEYISTEEVFNITVDNSTHTYWTGGLNVSNCGKVLPQSYGLLA